MPYTIDPKTKKKVQIDPTTGQAVGGMDLQDPGFQQTTTPAPTEQKGGLISNIKSAASGVAKFLLPASMNFAKDVGASAYVNSQENADLEKSKAQMQEGIGKLIKRANTETDPEKKKRLLDLAREQTKKAQEIDASFNPSNLFSEDVNKNPLERGLAVGTEIATTALAPSASGKTTAVGRIASVAKQGAIASGARTATSLEDMTPGERLKNTLISAGLGGLIVGGLQTGGEVVRKAASGTTKAGQVTEQLGSELKQSVRQIKEPAGVWGASKEEAINNTLDKLELKGTASQQYKQLEPAYEKLTKSIGDYLKTEKVPVSSTELASQIKTDLSDIPGDVLSDKQGKFEYTKIAKEIAKVKDSADVFDFKKWLNGRLGRVYTKIEKGNPLTSAEEVILQARDTVDTVITKLHPEIKDLTIAQSHLRDAAPSLNRARMTPAVTRIGGTTVPSGVIPAVKDAAGNLLQKTGKLASTVGKAETSALNFVNAPASFAKNAAVRTIPAVVTPQPSAFSGSEPIPEIPQSSQTSQQGGQPNTVNNNQPNNTHSGIVPPTTNNVKSTATGHSIEEHLQALSKATAAGDTGAIKEIKAQLAIEQDYQKAITPAEKKLTAQQIKDGINAQSGLDNLALVKDRLAKDKFVLIKAALPGAIGARDFKRQLQEVADVYTRLRTGAALNKEEIAFYNSQLPGLLDFNNPENITAALNIFENLFTRTVNQGSGLEDQLGGFSQTTGAE